MNILLIDDSNAVHGLLKSMLGPGNTYVSAFDGIETLGIFDASKFDLVLLDWEMPNLSGYETLQELRKLTDSVPIIMVTSLNKVENITMCMDAGANEYIMKPFTQNVLRQKVGMVVQTREGA